MGNKTAATTDVKNAKSNKSSTANYNTQKSDFSLNKETITLLVCGYLREIPLDVNKKKAPKDIEQLCCKYSAINMSSFTAKNKIVGLNKKIGDINIYDDNIMFDIIFKTPKKALPYCHNCILLIGDNYEKERFPYIGLIGKENGHIAAFIKGVNYGPIYGHETDKLYKWVLNKQYHLKIEFKNNEYLKMDFNGLKYEKHNKLFKIDSHLLKLPIYASLSAKKANPIWDHSTADGVLIESVHVESWQSFTI